MPNFEMPPLQISPAQLNFLLHCYYSPTRYQYVDSPLVKELIPQWIAADIITANKPYKEGLEQLDTYRVTDRGKAWVLDILSVPMPEACWKSKRDGHLIDL